jgi:ribosomal protein S19E (S16A)
MPSASGGGSRRNYGPQADGGRPAYEHIVRSTIHNLQEVGYLARVGRGRYCLTDTRKTRAVI